MRVRGTLRREGGRWACDVSALEPSQTTLERLDRGVSELPPDDAKGLKSWARWAERRGREFEDAELQKRPNRKAKALRIESGAARQPPDRPPRDGPRGQKSEPPRARAACVAYRAFQAQLATARTVEDLQVLGERIEAFFPEARTPKGGDVNLSEWEAPLANDPAGAYRAAPQAIRDVH